MQWVHHTKSFTHGLTSELEHGNDPLNTTNTWPSHVTLPAPFDLPPSDPGGSFSDIGPWPASTSNATLPITIIGMGLHTDSGASPDTRTNTILLQWLTPGQMCALRPTPPSWSMLHLLSLFPSGLLSCLPTQHPPFARNKVISQSHFSMEHATTNRSL